MSETDTDTDTATVREKKFNGTATFEIETTSARKAKAAAERFFREKHGERPTETVVQERDHNYHCIHDKADKSDHSLYDVIVTDHSSGTHADVETYEFDQ